MCRSTDATMHTVLMLSVADPFSEGVQGELCILHFCIFTPSDGLRPHAVSTVSTRQSTAVTHARPHAALR